MSFEKDKYEVVKKAISKDLASFCYAYFLNKRMKVGELGKIVKYQILILITEILLWKH